MPYQSSILDNKTFFSVKTGQISHLVSWHNVICCIFRTESVTIQLRERRTAVMNWNASR